MTLPVSIQLFTVRESMDKDPVGTLREISAMGYDAIETYAGTSGMEPGEYRALCDSLGLAVPSAHVSYESLCRDLDGSLKLYSALGTKYIVFPYMIAETRPGAAGYPEVVKNIKRFAAAADAFGIKLLYHNHDFEFGMIDGQYMLDYQFDMFSPDELGAEFDLGWVHISGVDPYPLLSRYAGRCPVIHMKDLFYHRTPKPGVVDRADFEFRPIGHGQLDIPRLITAAKESGVRYIVVEQDDTSMGLDALESAKLSVEHLKSLDI